MLELRFARRALRSIQNAERWLEERNPDAADRVLLEIERACGLLCEFPMIGVEVPATSLRAHVTRRYRYRIVYRVSGSTLEIRDVLHPRRNW